MKPYSKSERLNFSLVELLVVVAIIIILISILLPALGKARERGRLAVCQNQLKQFGLAHASYAQDWDDELVQVASTAPISSFWTYLLCPYINYDIPNRESHTDFSIWHCPSANTMPGYSPYRQRGYAMNRSIANFNYTPQQTRKLGLFKEPGKMFVMLDTAWDSTTLGDDIEYLVISASGNAMAWVDLGARKKYVIFRHFNRCSVLFVDGHVDSCPPHVPESVEGVSPKNVIWYDGGTEY